jgi:hypothetical protein
MPEPIQQAGYRIKPWCKAVGIGVALYFNLKREGKGPRETNLGRAVIIVEPPADYLARVAAESPAPARPPRPPPAAGNYFGERAERHAAPPARPPKPVAPQKAAPAPKGTPEGSTAATDRRKQPCAGQMSHAFAVGAPVEIRGTQNRGVVASIHGGRYVVRLTSAAEVRGLKFKSLTFAGAALKAWHPQRKSQIPSLPEARP